MFGKELLMKTKFPKYDNHKNSLSPIFQTFKPKDKKVLEDYLIFCGGSGGKTTINKYRSVLTKICDVFGGDLDKIDLRRLREFLNVVNQSDLLPTTKNEIRKVLKRFLRETYEDWRSRFKELEDIKTERDVNQKKINANTILKSNEIEMLVRGSTNLKYKAFIMTLWESASRPEELLKVKWKNINLEKGSIQLQSSKTGNTRINPIQESVYHLKILKEQYPFMDVSVDDYVFPSPNDRTKHISGVSAGLYFKRLGKKVLNRDIFLYLTRHGRLTELHKILPPKVYEKFADHSLQTATRYSHLDEEDVRDVMFDKVYKVKKISKEKKHEFEKRIVDLETSNQSLRKLLDEEIVQMRKDFRIQKQIEAKELVKKIK